MTNDVTGALPTGGSWLYEVQGMLEDAYDLGAQHALAAAPAQAQGIAAAAEFLLDVHDERGMPPEQQTYVPEARDQAVANLRAAVSATPPAAPAQAVAVPAEVELPDVEDMAHSAVQEALSFGVNHDVFHRWMRAVMDKTVQALAAAPAQEHATQLAGQGQAVPFRELLTGQVFRFKPEGPTFKRDKSFFVTMPPDNDDRRAMPADMDALIYPVAAAPAQAQAVAVRKPNRECFDAFMKAAKDAGVTHMQQRANMSGFQCADCKKPLQQGYDCGACGSFEAEEVEDAAPAQEHATQLAGQGQEQSPPAEVVSVADLIAAGNRFYRGNWISVEGVSELIDAARAAAPPAPATLPEGWTACRIEYEPGYPEDVAFGPQIMMDRLKKWLDRHFAALAAAPAQAQEDARDPAIKKPEAGRFVLAWTQGAKVPIRAMWAPQFFLEMAEDDAESGEYCEAKDQYFCPEGWYENNAHEETHWNVDRPVIAWMELPRLDAARAAQGGAA